MLNLELSPALVWNENSGHGSEISSCLKDAKRFTCMVAFAKSSGFSLFSASLRDAIDAGMSATFVVGIDFYQSEPSVLEDLLKLKKHGDVKVFMGSFERHYTFHPKLYLFEDSSGARAIVGSANMTQGGLEDNHELSVAFESNTEDLGNRIRGWIDELFDDREIVEATGELVKEYKRRHAIYRSRMAMAQRQAEPAAISSYGGMETLGKILAEMRADASEEGFDRSMRKRALYRNRGLEILEHLASGANLTFQEFLQQYDDLIGTMHSGGLHRAKTTVAHSREKFIEGVRSLLELQSRDPSDLFDHLRIKFSEVSRAGVNVITEILHLLDSERFAVMNSNSVSGMSLAGVTSFPQTPTKKNTDGKSYALFCSEAAKLREHLGLSDFSELDAVFNYAYWREIET